MEQLLENGWRLGGENSGHIICLDQTTTGDGIVAALQVLKATSRAGLSLYELRQDVQKLPQVLINVRFTEGSDPLNNDSVKQAVIHVENQLAKSGRVLLRKSGTEPLIRVMVEGESESIVTEYANHIADAVKQV